MNYSASDHPSHCLHLVLSPHRSALENCLAMFSDGDTILFLDAGVLHLPEMAADAGESQEAAFMEADLQARGLIAVAEACRVSVIGDEEFAGLLAGHTHCLSWK